MMRARKKILCAAAVIALAAALFYLIFPLHPLSSLKPEEIEEIRLFAIPPEQTTVLGPEDAAQAASLLRGLRAYQPGYRIGDSLCGQYIAFTVVKTDGSEVEVSNTGNVALTIGGTGYRAEYNSAEALNAFANGVLYSR